MSPALKIAAVFATMNRAATALACVRALAVQSRPPDLVIVADNVSNDDTVATLEAMAALPFPLIVHRMDENRGNAGGVKEVMEMAFAEGVDAVWILDDDSWPRAAALEAMVDGPWDPMVVRHPLQIDPRTNQFTWPLQVTDGKGGWRLISNVSELPDGECVRSRISWTGALVSREVREAIGPVNGDLFIRGEDEEYPLRMEQGGFSQEARRGAVMDHPGPQNLVCWALLGKSFFFEPGLSDWKIYYKVRNMVWIKRKQSGNRRAILMATVYALAAFQIDGIGRLPLIFSAAVDGWRGKLGKWEGHPS